LRETGYLVEIIDRLEAAKALTMCQQAGCLGDREVLSAQLLEGDGVEVDRGGAIAWGRRVDGGSRRGGRWLGRRR
jgi:hypothetical protein